MASLDREFTERPLLKARLSFVRNRFQSRVGYATRVAAFVVVPFENGLGRWLAPDGGDLEVRSEIVVGVLAVELDNVVGRETVAP